MSGTKPIALLVLLLLIGLYVSVATNIIPIGPTGHFQQQHQFPLPSVTSGSSFYWVGAESYNPSLLSNAGIRGTIQVISTPTTGCVSFWVADEMASNTVWGQVGYDICNGSTPSPFYEIWSSGAMVAQGRTSVTVGYHQFSMYLQSGTTWAYALDAVTFGTYDMSSSISSSTYPVEALSEEGYVSSPYNPSQVQFSTAIEVLKAGSWHSAPNGFEPYGCGSTGLSCWGVQGNLQNSSIPANAMMIGGNTSPVSAGVSLWNSVTPDFSITSSPTSVAVNAGATASSTITVAPVNGFTGTITLSSSVSPSTGLSCFLSVTSITLGPSQTSTLSCSGLAGTFTVTITGTSGSSSHSATVIVIVSNQPDFTISATSTSATILASETVAYNIILTPVYNFTGLVTLTSSVSPVGLACSLTQTSLVLGGTQSSPLSCTGPAGTYAITITGVNGALTHSISLALIIQDFSISASPTRVNVPSNGIGNATITIYSLNQFNGEVNLTLSVNPITGLTCTLSPITILNGSGMSTLSCNGSRGNYNVTLTGTSGSTSHSTTITFHQAGRYLLVVTTPSSGMLVTIDGVTWTTNSSLMVAVQVDDGPHVVLIQSMLPYAIGPLTIPVDMAGNTFAGWSDGNTSNPLVIQVSNDTVLTATYRPTIQTSSYTIVFGVGVLALISAVAVLHRRKHSRAIGKVPESTDHEADFISSEAEASFP